MSQLSSRPLLVRVASVADVVDALVAAVAVLAVPTAISVRLQVVVASALRVATALAAMAAVSLNLSSNNVSSD